MAIFTIENLHSKIESTSVEHKFYVVFPLLVLKMLLLCHINFDLTPAFTVIVSMIYFILNT